MSNLVKSFPHTIANCSINVACYILFKNSTINEKQTVYDLKLLYGMYKPWHKSNGEPYHKFTLKPDAARAIEFLNVGRYKAPIIIANENYQDRTLAFAILEKGIYAIFKFNEDCVIIIIYQGSLNPHELLGKMNNMDKQAKRLLNHAMGTLYPPVPKNQI